MNKRKLKTLKQVAHNLDPVFRIGKNGVSDNTLKAVGDYLKAHEIVKIKILDIPEDDNLKSIADDLAKKLDALLVSAIGKSFVLFKRNEKKPILEL